jgi:hypothetical protein
MNNIPDNLDWVTTRNECSAAKVFETLKLEIEKDIEIRNDSLRPGQKERYRFDMAISADGFSVYVDGITKGRRSIIFTISEDQITVRVKNQYDESVLFNAEPTVCNDGKCRLKVDKQDYELWQVRKMALEGLFFAKY